MARPLDASFNGPTTTTQTTNTGTTPTDTGTPSTPNINDAIIEARAMEIANAMLKERTEALKRASTGRVFTKFDLSSDVVANQKEVVTAGLWSSNVGTLRNFYTSSAASATQKTYYYEVWQSASSAVGSAPQFSIAYGHRLGSGSAGAGTNNDNPSRAIYSQYRLLLLEPNDTTFTFANSNDSDSIYAINIQRARLKETLDPGNFEIWLQPINGDAFANRANTGSNVTHINSSSIKLIDDSGDATQAVSTFGQAGRIHNIVSGTIDGGIYKDAGDNAVYYGLSYPDQGILILNGEMLDASASFNTVTASNLNGDNAFKLFTSLSGSVVRNISNTEAGFTARSSENVTSTHYFCRALNSEYNFSNNPTFATGALGDFAQATFINDPKVYITTIGLYNDRQELLAVAKLSKPILKSFTNETTVKVKLDF